MLGINKILIFTEIEIKQIQEILNDFSIIAKKMGVDITTTGIVLTTNRGAIELSYVIREEKKCQYYKKSIYNDFIDNIKADLFEELKKLC